MLGFGVWGLGGLPLWGLGIIGFSTGVLIFRAGFPDKGSFYWRLLGEYCPGSFIWLYSHVPQNQILLVEARTSEFIVRLALISTCPARLKLVGS